MAVISSWRAQLAAAIFAVGIGHASAQTTKVDLALVLAVDVSLSMDNAEQALQRDGYVTAFRDPELIDAIIGRGQGRIAVAYMEWGGSDLARLVVPWTVIKDYPSAWRFARAIETAPRLRANRTSISNALYAAGSLLEESGFDAARRVVDISGDGPNNQGLPVADARQRLIDRGITINGLPILVNSFQQFGFLEFRDLDAYYFDCVIGGKGAFIVPVRERGEFGTAIRRKLFLEIAGRDAPAQLIPAQFSPASDCLIGEKLWGQ